DPDDPRRGVRGRQPWRDAAFARLRRGCAVLARGPRSDGRGQASGGARLTAPRRPQGPGVAAAYLSVPRCRIGAVGDDVCGAGRPPTGRGKGMTAALLELALPLECAGCGARGSAWCAECDGALRGAPVPVRPRVPPGVPVWSAGTFVGARRGAVIAVKEQGRRDAVPPLAGAVRRLVLQLREAGEIDPPELSPVILVP